MTKVLIVYTPGFGNTKRMAEAVTDGARSVESTEVSCKEASEAKADDVRVVNAIGEMVAVWISDAAGIKTIIKLQVS
jgi:flavorubredoxin